MKNFTTILVFMVIFTAMFLLVYPENTSAKDLIVYQWAGVLGVGLGDLLLGKKK